MGKGGFSWKRATGVTKVKTGISRAAGVPITKSGRQRKVGKMVSEGGCLIALVTVAGMPCLLAAAFLGLASGCLDSPPSENSSSQFGESTTGGERWAGRESAKKITGPFLVAPASAKWPWESVISEPLTNGKQYQSWTVRGVVDAQNAAGVPIRHSWEVVVVEDKSAGKMFPIRVKLNGERVWGSNEAVSELNPQP